MMPLNLHHQFTSRNHEEIATMISAFNELNQRDQFCLYLDSRGWEVFDMKACVTVIRHKYRHLRDLTHDLRQLDRDLYMVGSEYLRPNKMKGAKIAIYENHLKRIYKDKFEILFPGYERRKKKEAMANCD